ncbi:MAG TPA: DNA polymerase IV [Acidiferrobacter sp.]|nr:DNA polymerase IV [Acidiferrobacter sp.]
MRYNGGVNSRPRCIGHLDMDAFFASVELLRHPELRGIPLVIGGRRRPTEPDREDRQPMRLGDYKGRGVVTTSTYEARALGVFSGMGIMKAAQYAPDAVLLPASFDAYRHYSALFKATVAAITPTIEDRGIDEIYIDLTDSAMDAVVLGQRLKDAVKGATGLSCSLGIAANKLLAKIASDLDKPDGLTLLSHADIRARLWPLPVGKINGIGPKASARLAALQIMTIGDLAATDRDFLEGAFGSRFGRWLADCAQGQDNRPLAARTRPKSLSRETTFERDLHPREDRALLSEILTMLCERLAEDLTRKHHMGRTVGIKLRYADFKTVTRDHTIPYPTADAILIRTAARECLRRVHLDQKLRLLGIRIGALAPAQSRTAPVGRQCELPFGDEEDRG